MKNSRILTVRRNDLVLWAEQCSLPGEPCLLIAGAGAISTFWSDEFCEQLNAAGRPTIRYDHRDAGNSSFVDFEKAPYGLQDLVEDALSVLDAAGVERADIVGHSMGGFIAQLLAIHHPHRVRSIVSISSHTASPSVPPPPEQTWQVLLRNKPMGDLDHDTPGYMEVWRFLNGDLPFDEKMALAYTRELYERNPATLPATNHVAIQGDMADRSERLGGLRVPVLVIHGDADPLVPVEGGRLTANAIPNAQLCVLPGAGHMFFTGATWRQIAETLTIFFKEQKGR